MKFSELRKRNVYVEARLVNCKIKKPVSRVSCISSVEGLSFKFVMYQQNVL